MPNRMIRDSALTSRTLNRLSDAAERLFWRLVLTADDYGRFDAEPAMILARCYPLRVGEIKPASLKRPLQEIIEIGSVALYKANGTTYGYFPDWLKHQRLRDSKSRFPAPPHSAANGGELPESAASRGDPPQVAASCGSRARPRAGAETKTETRDEDESREGDSVPATNGRRRKVDYESWLRGVFEKDYPSHRRVQHKTALAELRRREPSEDELAGFLARLSLWRRSDAWSKDSGQFVVGMGRFFVDGYCDRDPEGAAAQEYHPGW